MAGRTRKDWRQLGILSIVLFCWTRVIDGEDGNLLHQDRDQSIPAVRNTVLRDGTRFHENHEKENQAAARGRLYQWGPWGEASTCSRTCGVGVRYRKRNCYKSSNDVTHVTAASLCEDSDRRYELCNQQECPYGDDIRERQCSAHNRKLYRGRYYHWEPVSEETPHRRRFSQCAVVCTAAEHKYRVAVKFSDRVHDGTPCTVHNIQGLCVDNKCVPIGCDTRLYSTHTIDRCGVCGGYDTSCTAITGSLQENITLGYNRLLEIPVEARHIKVVELGGSSSVFALRNERSIYFVGGMHMASHPTVYDDVGGTTFYYHHPLYEENKREKIKTEGPTNETLYVMMLCPEPQAQVSIHYEYIIPRKEEEEPRTSMLSTPTTTTATDHHLGKHPQLVHDVTDDVKYEENILSWRDRYGRVHNYGYGNRFQETPDRTAVDPPSTNLHRTTQRTDRTSQTLPGESTQEPFASNNLPPYTLETRMIFYWKTDAKAACSSTCNPGVQVTYSRCYRVDDVVVDDRYCDMSKKPVPENSICEGRPCDPRWVTSMWSRCSVSCGEGRQFRTVRCWRMVTSGLDSTVLEHMCQQEEKPADARPCQEVDCGPLWQVSEWGQCSSKCGDGVQRRDIRCSSPDGDCDPDSKPDRVKRCSSGLCFNKWVVTVWSECSGSCGTGTKRRKVTCRDTNNYLLHDKFCDQKKRPRSIEACGDRPDCPAAWVAQDWGVCSVECGEGITTRQVTCGQVMQEVFKVRPNRYCSHRHRPATRARCREPICPPMWYTTAWSECSKSCGEGGSRVRRVDCYQNKEISYHCDRKRKPHSRESCVRPACEHSTGAEEAEKDECTDDGRTDCRLVLRFTLCSHWYYKSACCRSCQRASNSTTGRMNTTTSHVPITDTK